jgi:predicted lipid-binding transport protein (Tim44 family)
MKKRITATLPILGIVLAILAFVCISPELFARAGGGGSYGGGGGSGDSDGGGILYLVIMLLSYLPFPFNIIAVVIVLVVFFYFGRKKKIKMNQKSIFNNIPTGTNTNNSKTTQQKDIPLKYSNSQDIKSKIEYAFIQIQKGWQNQDLSKVRKFISDGVYQRFTTQFNIMNVLEQKNVIYDIKIHNISIVNQHEENEYAIVDAAIHATIVDQYQSTKYPQFNQGGSDTFVEYWSFIRKKDVAATNNLYSSHNCPKCGNTLPEDAGEVAKCDSCGTLTNSGEYDWVLAEITQTVDYNANGFKKGEAVAKKLLDVYKKDPTFSIQMMEDKASNGFLQILTARTKGKAELARRFVSDTYYTKLENEVKADSEKAYVRLYLNHVDLVNGYTKENLDHLVFNIKYTKQQLKRTNGNYQLIDQAPFTLNKVMVMVRASNAAPAKGQLYAHSCPNCAGPITDTIDTKCSYCGEALNSPNFEWIIDNVYDSQEYKQLKSQLNVPMVTNANPEDTEKLFKIRDYAFNNILIIMAADGVFSEDEKQHVNQLAKQFKYNEAQVSGWAMLAQQKKLSLIWPYEPEDKQKVYAMMEKAAMADNEIQPAEKALLDQAKQFLN